MKKIAIIFLTWFLCAPYIWAQSPAQISIIPGWRGTDGTHIAGLKIALAPGWKTYWRVPGDAGIPPLFDWSGSSNLQKLEVHWPTPISFSQLGMTSIGYRNKVVLPIKIRTHRANAPIALNGSIEIGVCQDVCVPLQARFSAQLLPTGRPNPELRAALADRPLTAQEGGVSQVECRFARKVTGMTLSATITMPSLKDELAVIEMAGQPVWISQAVTQRHGKNLTAVATLVPERGHTLALARDAIRITVLGRDGVVDIQGCS